MGRRVRRGILGLSLARLSRGHEGSRTDRIILKQSLSEPAALSERSERRTESGERAKLNPQSVEHRLVCMERSHRDGGGSEPEQLACPGIFGELNRAIQ
eukprot:1497191-Pyramimonas_sp.AAC.1